MLLSTIPGFSDAQPMPKALAWFFFVASLFLIFVEAFRNLAFRREWRRQAPNDRQGRFIMSARQRIETSLYKLGWVICWGTIAYDWWMRILFAGGALAIVGTVLYRNNLRVPDTAPPDKASMLHLREGHAAPAHQQN